MKENILIIQTAFIGDAILTLPMIKILKEKLPDSNIDVVSIPSTEEIFFSSPYVDNVFQLKKRNEHKSIFGLIKFGKELNKKNYTKLFTPHRSLRTAILSLIINCKESTGFSNSVFPFAFKKVIKYEYNIHEVARNLKLIGFDIEDENWKILPEINFNQIQINKTNSFINNYDNKKIVSIAPGSIWNTKKYPLFNFSKVVEWFVQNEFYVFIIGSDNDINDAEILSKINHDKVVSLAGKFTLLESALLLKKSKLLICNDSAPTHLGMIADIKVLTLYCSTVPEFGFYPYNKQSTFLSLNNLKCKPCGIHGYQECPLNHFDCGNQLHPDKVIKKIKEMLNVND